MLYNRFKLYYILVFMLSSTLGNGQNTMGGSTSYVHLEKASFKSRLYQSLFSLIGAKTAIEKKINKNKLESTPAPVPKSLRRKYTVTSAMIDHKEVWTIKPPNDSSEQVVLYLHGGAYIMNLFKQDWKLAETLVSRTNATVVVPDYPLSPEKSYKGVYAFMDSVYQYIRTEYPSKDIIVMGTSAGGGLALGYSMQLRDSGMFQPSQIILLSPWLDVSMSHQELSKFDKNDHLLGIKGLQMAGQLYAGDSDLKNYRVSPIYGNFTGLGKVSVFIGTNDLFIADSRKLREALDAANNPFGYFEYPKMFHGWMAFQGLKESEVAINQIVELVND